MNYGLESNSSCSRSICTNNHFPSSYRSFIDFYRFFFLNICFIFCLVLGSLGYYIEQRYHGTAYTPVPHEKPIVDERFERQDQQEMTATPYKMETIIPKTIFEKNNPEALKKSN